MSALEILYRQVDAAADYAASVWDLDGLHAYTSVLQMIRNLRPHDNLPPRPRRGQVRSA